MDMSTPTPMLDEHHLPTDAAAAQALAQDIAQRLSQAIAQRGLALLCVSGGKSPIPLFKALSAQALDWAKVSITLVDERCVPVSHPDSNTALVQQHLLQGPAAAARFISWIPADYTAMAAPAAWADRSTTLQAWSDAVDAALRPLWPADVVVLGMGMDGHTASLFSQAQGLAQAIAPTNASLCAAIRPPHAPHDRLSLSLGALKSARHVALQLQGAAKRQVYELARAKASTNRPVSLVLHRPAQNVSVWMAD
jgi:6-phosphogluconolactonase